MEIFSVIILGLVQGLTEFLPISSSGHLIIFRDILGLQNNLGLAFDAVLQLATTLAIIIYFRKDLLSMIRTFHNIFIKNFRKDNLKNNLKDKVIENKNNIVFIIIIATIPAIIFGLLLENFMETVFRSSLLVSFTLILGSIIMFAADKFAKQNKDINLKNAFVIGLFQCLALIPGMSRSGMTISGGLLMGLNREKAARLSFLIAIPILLGSGLKKMFDLIASNQLFGSLGFEILIGSIFAFLSGLLAIHFLITYLKKHDFKIFIFYRLALAIVILFIL
jgi:undecaprenyl-diphosphatase